LRSQSLESCGAFAFPSSIILLQATEGRGLCNSVISLNGVPGSVGTTNKQMVAALNGENVEQAVATAHRWAQTRKGFLNTPPYTREAARFPCDYVHSPFRSPHANPTLDRHVDVAKPICLKSSDLRPNLMNFEVVLRHWGLPYIQHHA
jgi:hypothetical protein